MKRKIPIHAQLGLALAAALAFLSGCATGPEIKFEADKTTDLTALKKFVIIPFSKTKGIEGAEPGAGLKYAPAITSALKTALTAKGLTEVTTVEEADVAVNVRATIVPKTEITDWGMGYAGYGRWGGGGYWGAPGMGYNTTIDQYNEGVLRIELYSVKSKDLVWVGWAKNEIYKAPDDATIHKVITDILANFPIPLPPKK